MTNNLASIEKSLTHHREVAAQLQRRLSERRQECVSLGKDLYRARESARIANEVADNVERQLEDIGTAYDVLCVSHKVQAERIAELENQTFLEFLASWWHWIIVNSCTTEAIYYGLPR